MPLVTFQPAGITVDAAPGTLLAEAARAAGLPAELPCGGRGVCGKCLALVTEGAVDFADNGAMPHGLAGQGWVLICRAKLLDGPVTVRLSAGVEREKGQFSKANDDRLLVDEALLPGGGDIDPPVRKVCIAVPAPAPGDGLSDYDRLTRALSAVTGLKDADIPLPLLRALPEALRERDGAVTVAYSQAGGFVRLVALEPGDTAGESWGIAVDVGTTTVAVQLTDLTTGAALASRTAYNAQIECGLDVISRINYAKKPERLNELRDRILGTVNKLTAQLSDSCSVDMGRILAASVAGNTTMTHLLLGIPPEYIRLDPYVPTVHAVPACTAQAVGLDICSHAPVLLAPSVGSYVGGDITSGLLCTSLSTETDEICLFIDIGTNGELVLGNGEFLMGCACSAGPAFEGGGIDSGMRASQGAIEWVDVDRETGLPAIQVIGGGKPAGICGSGMISLIANLFEAGWLDAGGRLDRTRPCPAIETQGRSARYVLAPAEATAGGRSVAIGEADIDNLIRAKAAIFSACRVMLRKIGMGFEDLSCVYIAGGFGRYLDVDCARQIGLIPGLPRERFRYIGNSSLLGAAMALVSARHRQKVRELAGRITYIDLGAEPEYMDEYTAALFLPHTDVGLFENME